MLTEPTGAGRSRNAPELEVPASARVGLLFLSRGGVHHPKIWWEFVADAPNRVRVFSHPKHPEELQGEFLEGTAVREHFETVWGGIGLVKAARAILLEALVDRSVKHSCFYSKVASRSGHRLTDMIHSGAFARKFPKGADIGKSGLDRSVGVPAGEPEMMRSRGA